MDATGSAAPESETKPPAARFPWSEETRPIAVRFVHEPPAPLQNSVFDEFFWPAVALSFIAFCGFYLASAGWHLARRLFGGR